MRPGDLAPDFALPDETGNLRRLSEFLADGPVVLFFYPAAMTVGCTAEACHFRDLGGEFRALGAQRVGISRDAIERQAEFSEVHRLGFPLLSDTEGKVAELFGVRRTLPFLPLRRWTFVIGADGRMLGVIKSETKMSSHGDRALELLGANR